VTCPAQLADRLTGRGSGGAAWRPRFRAGKCIDVASLMRQSWLVGTNGELLAAAAAGDQRAWDTLVERHTSLLWSIARSYRLSAADAADVVQTTWLRLVEHLGKVADPERLPGWLATTARRECIHLMRRTDRHAEFSAELPDLQDDGPAPDAALLRDERDAELWRALARLDELCQRLLRVLMADPPLAYADVAAVLGIKIGSIGPTRARCLAKLRGLVQSTGQAAGPG
jgi:RNA polymerase sigma factor (sigma-70 family)